MSYVDEVINKITKENPGEPEFPQTLIYWSSSRRKWTTIQKRCSTWKISKPWKTNKIQSSLGWWRRTSSSKHRIPCTIQQCNWSIQRRITFPPFSKHRYYKILRIWTNIQKLINRTSNWWRKRRIQLRS